MFTKKKKLKNGFLHFHYWKFNNDVVATHVALSLPVETVKKNAIIQFVGCRPSQKTELF